MALPVFVRSYMRSHTNMINPVGQPGWILVKDPAETKRILSVVRWQINNKKPCVHVNAALKEIFQAGSANIKTNTICLSAERLLGYKFTTSRVNARVLALAFGEFSHLLGTTEQQAKQLQKDAVQVLYDYSFSTLSDFTADYKFALDKFITDALNARHEIIHAQKSELVETECVELTTLSDDFGNLNSIGVRTADLGGIGPITNSAAVNIEGAASEIDDLINNSCEMNTYNPTPKPQAITQLTGVFEKLVRAEKELVLLPTGNGPSYCVQ